MNNQNFKNNSDLCVLLSHVNSMLGQMDCCVNTIAMQSLSLAIAVESTTLTWKLQQMLKRWELYIPFHECSDVDFHRWHARILKTYRGMKGTRLTQDGTGDAPHHPDAPFRLDLTDDLRKALLSADGDMGTEVSNYVLNFSAMVDRVRSLSKDGDQQCRSKLDDCALKVLHRQYSDYLSTALRTEARLSDMEVEMKIIPWMDTYFQVLAQQPFMVYCIDMAIDNLLSVLQQIDSFFNSEFSDVQFQRLTLRLFHRLCPDATVQVRQELNRWKSTWPRLRKKESAQKKRDELLTGIRQRCTEPALDEYIDTERPNPLGDAEFGRFLFASRQLMTHDDVRSLFLDLFRIHELNRLIDPEGVEADLSAAHLNAERKAVYQQLCVLVRKAEWQGGMTPERVHHCFARILMPNGGTHVFDDGAVNYTELFWNLLLHRRGCDTDFRSLKLTWLNLVGYFCSRGFLKGGSPALCRFFFPDGTPEGQRNDTDYNAITKGSGDRAGNDFHDLITLLDRLLGLDPPK